MKGFEIAGGSVPGTDHTLPGKPGWKNNQDAFTFRSTERSLVAIVSDGCGQGEHSEVGSHLGAHLAATSLSRALERGIKITPESSEALLQLVKEDVLQSIAFNARMMDFGHKLGVHVIQNFLFTIVGFAMEEETTMVFSFGDGVFAVNGEVQIIPPAVDNAPAYLGQCLISGLMPEKYLRFNVHRVIPTKDVHSILIGTDGLKDVIATEDKPLPGKQELMGPLKQFWENPKYASPDQIRRRLALANLETVDYVRDETGVVSQARIKQGLLRDDTTLVVARREP